MDVIRRLHAHGVYFGIASGRSIDQQLHKQARDWGFDFDFEVLIGMNGSELWDGIHQKRFDYYKLKKEWIREIVELMAPFNLNPFMYVKDKMMCLRVDEATERSSKKNRTDILVVDDLSDFMQKKMQRLCFGQLRKKWKALRIMSGSTLLLISRHLKLRRPCWNSQTSVFLKP